MTELRRFVHAYAEMLAEPVAACGGRLVAGDGFLAADAGRPAGFFNGAMLLHPPDFERWPEMLARVEAALLGDGAGDVYLWSAWPTPDLRARGWELEGFPPYLLRLPGGPLPPDAPDLSVRPVTDAAALADWERVVVEGYPFGATLPWRPGVLVDERVLGSRYRMWVGYTKGQPVGPPRRTSATACTSLASGSCCPDTGGGATGRRCSGHGSPGSETGPRRRCSAT